jgi:amino acid transporter
MKATEPWLPYPAGSAASVVTVSGGGGGGGVFAEKKAESDGGYGVRDDGADSTRQGELQRQLSGRHLNFIAIGGTIGTGFFLSTGTALTKAGPAGCLISYVFVGTMLWSVMVCLGEMATYMPTAGAFSAYATRFVDPSLGFAVGWLYWFACELKPS